MEIRLADFHGQAKSDRSNRQMPMQWTTTTTQARTSNAMQAAQDEAKRSSGNAIIYPLPTRPSLPPQFPQEIFAAQEASSSIMSA